VRDAEAVKKAVTGTEVIYHCAAMVMPSGRKEDFFGCNVLGTQHLLAAAQEVGVKKVVHVSSVAVYGPGKKTIVREDDEYDPFPQRRGYYAWSKIEADRLALQFSQERGLPVTVLRPGIIYGPGAKPFFARLHYNFRDKAHVIIGSPQALLPLVFVGSLVEAMFLAGQQANGGTAVYNIVDGAITQGDYLRRQAEVLEKRLRAVYLPPRLVYPGAALLEALYAVLRKGAPALSRYRLLRACQSLTHDTSKARKELGWRPLVSLPDGLKQTWQWWQQNSQH
jgi:nucleoside-diphosphate-sugar epimerase